MNAKVLIVDDEPFSLDFLASIIIYNMPLHDPDLYGRLKDTAVKIAEALDAHMRALEWVTTATDRSDRLLMALEHNAGVSRDIESRIKTQREENLGIVNRLVENIEQALASSGLTGKQTQPLKNLLRDALAQAQATHNSIMDLEVVVKSLCTGLDETLLAESRSTPDSDAAPYKSVELF